MTVPDINAPKFVSFPVSEFHQSGFLWFANTVLFWPLGLSLVVNIDKTQDPPQYSELLLVREWRWDDLPDYRESIEDADLDRNNKAFAAFVEWARERVQMLPELERARAIKALGDVGVAIDI